MLPVTPTTQAQPPLAYTLLDSLVHLLFVPNFTVASSTLAAISAFNCVADLPGEPFVWSNGLGPRTEQGAPTAAVATARNDVLRLLLVCCSHVMYEPAATANPADDGWLRCVPRCQCPLGDVFFGQCGAVDTHALLGRHYQEPRLIIVCLFPLSIVGILPRGRTQSHRLCTTHWSTLC
jgi:hypothetical protein